jgi:hypothetical protein
MARFRLLLTQCAHPSARSATGEEQPSAMLAFMEAYDVILCLVNAWPALPHDTWRDAFRRLMPGVRVLTSTGS